ncbi:hypothetical protein CRYPA_1399 [uncultured Candidatus Thioglobus sp.]|nr:hypothetical protein CRYPA_1399 [uncultured Candidatus Thioglobus sp.]
MSFEWLATGRDSAKGDNKKHNSVDDNTKTLRINQLLGKTTPKQKDYLLELLSDITR